MKNISLLFTLFLLSHNFLFAQPEIGSFDFEGHTRNYEVYLPQNFHANMPVVFVLHGYTQSISQIKGMSGMYNAADTMGFITVYPKSASISWNTGETKPPYGWGMYDTTVNDVGFISALIDTIDSHFNVDLNRIYVCGFSSGGEMTFRLIAELGQCFAAAASVSGPLNEVIGNIEPIRPFPILHMHGTSDPFISYANPYYNLWSVEKTLNYWIDNNGCSLPADTIPLPDVDTTDGCTVEKISYTNCLDNTEVIFYKIINGGHSWPSSTSTYSDINKDINANIEILNFFSKYENPLVNLAWTKNIEVSPKYIEPSGGTLSIKAYNSNPENHSVTVYSKIYNDQLSFSDSLLLYDDGLHNDENPNDNIWGNTEILSNLEEDIFIVDVYTQDLTAVVHQKYFWPKKITTAGPLKLDSIVYLKGITNYYNVRPFVHNDGTSKTITGAQIRILCDDPWVSSIGNSVMDLPDIGPDETVGGSSWSAVGYIDTVFPGYFNFKAELMVDGWTYWTDSLQVIVTGVQEEMLQPLTFKLEQNYPNPFNPTTKISYSIPQSSDVFIRVFDILGNEIETLVNEEKSVGSYQATWNAENLPSGVYFYQLQAGDFVETKKMMLLK